MAGGKNKIIEWVYCLDCLGINHEKKLNG